MVFRLHRPLTFQRPVLVDADLHVHGVDEVLGWAKNGADIVVIDNDTGDDITRILFAHWDDGCLVDPIGERPKGEKHPADRND
jgi:hypothetical protein